MSFRSSCVLAMLVLIGCGPGARNHGDDDPNAPCTPGHTRDCYDGASGTEGVGPCHGGTQTCGADKVWSACTNEVVPQAENCTDGIDNNCNGMVDEDVDLDGDGFTTCGGHDCCDSTECSNPSEVNPGAFDAPGDGVDNDCDGTIDNPTALCDSGLASNTGNAMDFAKAIDLCQTTTMSDKKWGVISAQLTLANGSGTPNAIQHSIRTHFGTGVMPKLGQSMALLATGAAAGKGDSNPGYDDFQNGSGGGTTSAFPQDFYQANGNKLPNAPGCPGLGGGNTANSPVMLTLTVRVPTNAKSFKLLTNFYSSEFPEYTCSPYNDFFVVLLDSAYSGQPANPSDKNLAFYSPMGTTQKYPVGVNLAHGDTGLFTQCVNGPTGCAPFSTPGSISTCTGTTLLAGTGMDTSTNGCGASKLEGGGTGWLQTSGNVNPGEIMKLRVAIWNTSDDNLQSLAIIDGFQWDVDTSDPGTVIFRRDDDGNASGGPRTSRE